MPQQLSQNLMEKENEIGCNDFTERVILKANMRPIKSITFVPGYQRVKKANTLSGLASADHQVVFNIFNIQRRPG